MPKNIHQKLNVIFKLVEVMKKDTKGYNFTYVNEENILAKITVGLESEKLQVYPSIVPGTSRVIPQNYTKIDKKTGIEVPVYENLVMADMVFTWVDIDNPSDTYEVPWALFGQQLDASQAFGSALSYCIRYFYLKFFHVATTKDDPDTWRSKQLATEDEKNQGLLEGILEDVNTKIADFYKGLSTEDAQEKLTEFIKLNNKGSQNYMKIKNINEANVFVGKITEYTKGESK